MQKTELAGLVTRNAAPIPLVGVTATGTIIGRAARVKIRQRFENREDNAIEAVYKFPLPESASVCGFTVATGNKVLRGQVEEREKAFRIYDEALSGGDGAYLLDEERPNIFTISVGNVNARNAVDVEIEYVSLLETNDGEVRFFLPTTISPRYVPPGMPDQDGIPVTELVNPKFQMNVPYGLDLRLDVLGREDIDSLECPSHTVQTRFADHAVAVEFSSDTVAMDRDFVLVVRYRRGFENKGFAFSDNVHAFVQIDFAPQFGKVGANQRPVPSQATEVVILLDCSGSMSGSSIQQAKKALELFLRGMQAGMQFNVYRFGSTYEKLFPVSIPYDSSNLSTALRLLGNVEADLGGTELLSPLRDIYSKGPPEGCARRSIILLTDGQVGNEDEILKLAQSDRRTRLFTVGIGHGPNEYLMKKAASLSGGASELVAPGERIEPRVLRLFNKVAAGGVDDLKVAWTASAEQAPLKPVPHRGECVSILARLARGTDAPKQMELSGRVNGVDMTWQVGIRSMDDSGGALPLLWARQRISDLENGIAGMTGSHQTERRDRNIRERIVEISRQYGLLSRETSFIATESRVDGDKTTGETVLRKVPVMLTKGWGGHGAEAGIAYALVAKRIRAPARADAKLRMEYCMPTQMTGPADFCQKCAPEGADRLSGILALQTADGGFLIASQEQATDIGMNMAELHEAAAKLKASGRVDSVKLVCTAVVLALLEAEFSNRRDEWYAVVGKSRRWFSEQVKRFKPTIDGVALKDWTTK